MPNAKLKTCIGECVNTTSFPCVYWYFLYLNILLNQDSLRLFYNTNTFSEYVSPTWGAFYNAKLFQDM